MVYVNACFTYVIHNLLTILESYVEKCLKQLASIKRPA